MFNTKYILSLSRNSLEMKQDAGIYRCHAGSFNYSNNPETRNGF
ncbi:MULTISPECIES: hypothetical protein [Providencia]|nr:MULTISPECIES: hypothetical protein [Providencia]